MLLFIILNFEFNFHKNNLSFFKKTHYDSSSMGNVSSWHFEKSSYSIYKGGCMPRPPLTQHGSRLGRHGRARWLAIGKHCRAHGLAFRTRGSPMARHCRTCDSAIVSHGSKFWAMAPKFLGNGTDFLGNGTDFLGNGTCFLGNGTCFLGNG